jgi:quercetin dioxygenase-like cupin family protein
LETKAFSDIERYQPGKHTMVSVFDGERTKVRLLCLSPGAAVPTHGHPGFEVTLQPLQGKGFLSVDDRDDVPLEPGQVHYSTGTEALAIKNPHVEAFQLLIHLVKTE